MRDSSRAAGRAVVAAVTFLTVAPLGRRVRVDGADVSRATPLLPVVGAALGVVAGCTVWLLPAVVGPLTASVAAVAVLAAATGALHLDGVADTADGFGGRTPQDRLRIMRDHAVGAYGVVALVLALLLKVAAAAAVAGRVEAVAIWLAAGAWSRSVGPVLAAALPYAQRPGGSGAVLHGGRAATRAAAAGLVALGLTAAASDVAGLGPGTATAAAAGTTVAVAVVVGGQARQRLGGVSGDVLGAATELTEIAVLVVLGTVLR